MMQTAGSCDQQAYDRQICYSLHSHQCSPAVVTGTVNSEATKAKAEREYGGSSVNQLRIKLSFGREDNATRSRLLSPAFAYREEARRQRHYWPYDSATVLGPTCHAFKALQLTARSIVINRWQ